LPIAYQVSDIEELTAGFYIAIALGVVAALAVVAVTIMIEAKPRPKQRRKFLPDE
jgi:hypothetical protein